MIAAVAILVLAPKPIVAFLPTVTTSMEAPADLTAKERFYLNDHPWPDLRAAGATFDTPDVLEWAHAMQTAGLPVIKDADVKQPEGFGYNLNQAVIAARAVGASYLVATWISKVKRHNTSPYEWMSLSGTFTMEDLRAPKGKTLCVLKGVSIMVNATKEEPGPVDVRRVITQWADRVHTAVGIEITKANKKKS